MAHRCPHKNIQFCPLYYAAHGLDTAGGRIHSFGCDDGHLEQGACAVNRGMSYAAELEKVRSVDPHLVATLAWREDLLERRAQMLRNLTAAGLH